MAQETIGTLWKDGEYGEFTVMGGGSANSSSGPISLVELKNLSEGFYWRSRVSISLWFQVIQGLDRGEPGEEWWRADR